MGFSGDLKDIDLANIFQTLGMNQHEGILKVSDPNRLAEIYFSKRGIRLLVDDTKPYSLLGELLLRKRLVTENDLRRALKIQKESGNRMGEILVEHGMLSEEDLAKVLREQMEEKIYEIFSWKEARFEFEAGALAPEDPFFSDGKTEEQYLTFNINSIMMEAARRIDEWGLINQSIPSRTEVIRLIHPAAEVAKYEYGLPQEDVAAVVGRVNGRWPVERIIRECGLGNFRTCKILKALIDQGHAELIPTQDLLRLASSFTSAGRSEDAIEIFRTAVARTPDDTELRVRLAEAALDSGKAKVAAEEYRAIGEIHEKNGEKRKALQSYTTAVELDRSSEKTHERLYSLYQELHERHLALEEGRVLARLYTERKRYAKAEAILLKLKGSYVLDVATMKLLVKIYLDRKEKAKAIAELESLAHSCEVKKRYAEADEAYQTILRLDRSRKDIEQKASRIAHRLQRGGGPKIAVRAVLALVLLGLVGAGGWFVTTKIREALAVKKAIDEVAAGVSRLADLTKLEDDDAAYEAAKRETVEWLEKVAGMTERFGPVEDLQKYKDHLTSRLEMLDGKIDSLRERICSRNYRRLLDAKRWKEEGKLAEALAAAKEVIASEHNYQSTLDDAKDLAAEIESRQKGAAGLLLAARDAEAEEFYEEAYRLYDRLLKDYPHSDSVDHVLLPLVLESDPPGARVSSESGPMGITPVVFRYDPEDEWTLTLTMPGYEDLEISRRWVPQEEQKAAKLSRKLKKKFEWLVDLGSKAKVTADLVCSEGTIFAPTIDGRVLFIDPKEREARLGVDTGDLGEIAAPGVLRDGILYVGSKNSKVMAIQTRTGDKLWEQTLGDFPEKVVTSPAISEDGRVLTVAGGKVLFALDAIESENRAPIWTLEFDRDIAYPPVVIGETVLIPRPGTREVLRLSLSDKAEVGPAITLPAAPTGPLILSEGGTLIYPDAGGQVRAINPGSGGLVWSTPELGRIRAARPLGDRVWVSLEGGTVLGLLLESGQEVWRKEGIAGDAVSASRFGDTLYFGTDAGSALSMKADTGDVRWEFTLPSPVAAAPCLGGDGHVFFGCLDGKVYAVLQ